jgi:3D (Asp-Asp-Asp) domain-containing protein
MRRIDLASVIMYALGIACIAFLIIGVKSSAQVEQDEQCQEVIVEKEVEVEVEKVIEVAKEVEVYVVTATVYHAVEGQCDESPLVTASGAKISSTDTAYDHRYLAVSRDLLDMFPYGTMVEVSGCGELDGVYTVADTMNKRYKGYIDLLINPDMKGGKWTGVRIKKVE